MSHQNIELEPPDEILDVDKNLWIKAMEGKAVAQLELGKAYFHSDGTEINRFNTLVWISRYANQGNLEAQFTLGDLYALGWGTKQCHTSAYEWYTRAAIQGYKKALTRIHNLYQEDVRMHCRGQLNTDEEKWADDNFKHRNNVRELNEYRLKINKAILNGAIDYYRDQFKKYQASKQDDPHVQQYLGFLYQHGYGVKKYASVAINYYTKAAEQGLVGAQYNLGLLYQHNTNIKFNYRKALRWYTLAADAGNVAAQNLLAHFYEKGLATGIDHQKALYWYTKATNAGHSGAQLTLGKWYRQGKCIKQDYKQALKWYKLAAKQGNQVAQNCLDLLYQNGERVDAIDEEDVPEYSIEPSRKSRLCSKLRLDIEKLNETIKTEHLKKLALKALKGDGNAMYEIGLKYYDGIYFTQDKDIGFQWIRNAANAEHKEAQFKLAEMYKQGDTIDQDYYKTSIWTKKLAKKKDAVAQYNVGILYRDGLGVRKDYLEASKWFICSSDQGSADAMYELAKMKFDGLSFKQDEEEAVEMYYKAAIGGNMDACFRLGRAYWIGWGAEKNKDKALQVYDYAAKHGNTDAQLRLGEIYDAGEDLEANQSKANIYYSMISSTDNCDTAFHVATTFLSGYGPVRDNEKAFYYCKIAAKYHRYRTFLFDTPIVYSNEIRKYHSLIDMFIEISQCGIENLEYNVGYAYEHGIHSETRRKLFTINNENALEWYTVSANKSDARAQYRLGIMHEEGKGTEKNITAALDYYRKAANNSNIDAKYRLACMYLKGYYIPQDTIKAFYLFTDAANMSHLKSRRALMLLDEYEGIYSDEDHPTQYEDILLTEKDQLEMLETMAEHGLVAIQYQLGKLYQNKNDPMAIRWLTLAAQGGISDACYRLGVINEEGKYLKKNYERALELYEKASEGDHEDAIYRLATMYQLGKGTPTNYTEAYSLYIRASEIGHESAFKALNITGDLYKSSTGAIKEVNFDNKSEEVKLSLLMCEHVAEQGDPELQYKIATVYEDHLEEPRYPEALKWYQMAAANSHAEAIYRLGLLYEKGLGVCQDYQEAIRLFEKAKSLNSSDAIFRLGMVYQYGYGVDTDSHKTVEHYILAASLGNSIAQYTIGTLYEEGILVPKSPIEALKWYTQSYSQGYDVARSKLLQIYEDPPYEDFFYEKLLYILRLIVSTGLPAVIYKVPIQYIDNYRSACSRLVDWYYHHGDFKSASKYLSKTLNDMVFDLRGHDFFSNEYIDSEGREKILNELQTQKELVDSLHIDTLFHIGKGYYEGVFDESVEDESKRVKPEGVSLRNEDRSVILKQDYSKALFFLKKTADKDLHGPQYHLEENYHYGAQYYIGEIYHYGYGVKTDLEQAREWYDKASTDIFGFALEVGMLYHCDGELQDFSKALKYYEKCNYSAYLGIGILYLYGAGVDKDYKKAMEYLEKEFRAPMNFFYLGVAYYNGPGDIRNYDIAFQFFQKVIEQGPDDMNKMIFARIKNDSELSGTSQNHSFTLEPETVFHGEAYYYLGIMYKNGQGTTQNERKSKECFSKAIMCENEKAKQYTE